MWDLDHKEGWMLKNWCFWIVVPKKTLESPPESMEVKPVNPKKNKKIILNTHCKDWCWNWSSNILATWCKQLTHWKRLMLEKTKGRRRKGRQDEMVGWHHQLNEHVFECTPGDGEGQGSLACCSSWACTESDMTQRLNNELWNYKKLLDL